MFKQLIAAAGLAAAVSACVTTNTVPISPDTFRLDTTAQGAFYTESAGAETLMKAAEITLQKGYSHFRIVDSASASDTKYAGSSFNRIGTSIWSSPNYMPTQNVSVVVQMLQRAEQGAWSAAEVIAAEGKMF